MAVRLNAFLLFVLTVSVLGCQSTRPQKYVKPASAAQAMHQTWRMPIPALEAVSPVAHHLEGPHPVEAYIAYALQQNPDIHAARQRLAAQAYQVPVEASLPDPMLNLTSQPNPVQTAAGEQNFILTANQRIPWPRKLATRAAVAESRANIARADFAAKELAVIAQVKRAYYQIYFIQQAIHVTESDQGLLNNLRDVAITRYKAGQTSQQDVLRADLEIANVENELIRLRQQLISAQARLGRLLHVAPQTDLRALDNLPAERIPEDLEFLQQVAVAARPELHARLAALQRDQRAVALSRLEYKPDVTLGMSWISVSEDGISPVANGDDALFLTAGFNLPIYRKRLSASVRSAAAQASASAREYDSLRDMTLEEVTDLFAQVQSQRDLLNLFNDNILPSARQTLEVSSRAYNVGEVDFLQLIDNWRQLLRYEISYERLQADLRQSLAELERLVGSLPDRGAEEVIPVPPGQPTPLRRP